MKYQIILARAGRKWAWLLYAGDVREAGNSLVGFKTGFDTPELAERDCEIFHQLKRELEE